MANLIIDRRTYAFRKSLIIQRSRNTSHMNCHGMYQIIYFLCGYAGSDHFSHSVQNSPLIRPFSSTSIRSAAGRFGRPGIVMMSPA